MGMLRVRGGVRVRVRVRGMGMGYGVWVSVRVRVKVRIRVRIKGYVLVYRSAKNFIRFFWDELRTLPVGLSI